MPYVGPTPNLEGVSTETLDPLLGLSFQTSIEAMTAPIGSSTFSLFGGRSIAPESMTHVSVGTGKTQYKTPQVSNTLDFGWNPF